MSLPEVTMTIQDRGLGQIPASVANASVALGICSKGTPNEIQGFSDLSAAIDALGQGQLVEAVAQILAVAGGPVYAVPVNPSVQGEVGAVTHEGTGDGTVVPDLAPDRVIIAKITTGGTINTMAFAVSVDGGEYSDPITTSGGAPFSYAVPGTLTTLHFAAGTYVQNDLYTVNVDGTIVLTGSGPSTVTQDSSPNDAYDVIVEIMTDGELGEATFRYSLDGGNAYSSEIAVPGGGVYTIPATGLFLTFADEFVEEDTYSFTTTGAGYGNDDVQDALDEVMADSREWGFLHVVGQPEDAAAAASLAGVVDTAMTAAATAFRYAWAIVECPTIEAEDDDDIIDAFEDFVSDRTMVCVGDVGLISPISGRTLRRNCAWAVAARAAAVRPSEDLAYVGRGRVANIASLYRNEAATPGLDAQRFTTMRTFTGLSGYYITNGKLMAEGSSDFTLVQYRRVMDRACQVTRAAELPFLSGSVRIDTETGYIDERDAQRFEATVGAQLNAAVIAPGDASSASVVMNRSTNLLSTGVEPVTVRIVPLAYLKTIETDIGFSNPALAA